MAADSLNERSPLRRRFPVLRFLEISSLALSPASVLIACLSLLVLDTAGWMVNKAEGPVNQKPPVTSADPSHPGAVVVVPREIPRAASQLAYPWTTVVAPSVQTVRSTHGLMVQFWELVRAAIAFVIWSIAGLILCRRAVFLFAGNDQYSFLNAVNYSQTRWLNALLAPAIPLSAALAIGLLLVVYGFVGRIPYLGTMWLAALSPLAIIAGLFIATFLIATALGWPLMVAAVAADDCDGFGGLSRAYSGITGRPWPFAGYLAISLFVGTVLGLIVTAIGNATIGSVLAFTALGAGTEHTTETLVVPITHMVTLIQRGIGVSFFWTAATVTYLFLRHEIDGLPLDHVASAEDPAPARDPLPVVGIPATDSHLKAATQSEEEALSEKEVVSASDTE